MKSLLPLLTFLLFFSGISPSLLPPQEFRFALLIGNADYDGTARLQNPVNDIRRLSPLFKKYGFEVTQLENANQEVMEKGIDDFGKKINETRQKNPQAQIITLFYYSGHGLSYEGLNYLIPIKTEIPNPESLQYTAKSLEAIISLFSSSDVRLLFFDACRNEPPTRSWWRALPNIDENQGLSGPEIEESTPRQNSNLNGTCIGYATALGKRALDGNISISPYAEAFEKELIENASQPLSDLLTNMGQHVGKITHYAQDPWQSSTRTVGRFCFDVTPQKTVKEEISSSLKVEEINKKENEIILPKKDLPTIKILPNDLKLILVEGGSFMMGSNNGESDEKPVHGVTLDSYYMGEAEITNAQYAVFLNEYGSHQVKTGEYKGQKMIEESQQNEENNWGLNKKNNQWKPQKGYENHPVIYVTWYGANEFCKYYGGILPSEAQWEYAARGGNKSNNYVYAGSDELKDIAWSRHANFSETTTHSVKTKISNELGLYDMSGNVFEWCQDWYDEKYHDESNNLINPINDRVQISRVLRGGSWDYTQDCRSTNRSFNTPKYSGDAIGFRICLFDVVPKQTAKEETSKKDIPTTKILSNGIKLIKVEGSSFMMGSDEGAKNEKPVHKVTLDDYYIGETEVTNAQYAVFLNEYASDYVKTGEYKGQDMIYYEDKWGLKKENNQWKPQKGYENHPVIYVKWYQANEFCKYYGGTLPSEAQWEYAARGGNKSNNLKFAGGDELNEVAWNGKNSNAKTHSVKTKISNELDLYDMSGNVAEWCQDWYDEKYYEESNDLINPINTNEEATNHRVLRGGSWYDNYPRSTSRSFNEPKYGNKNIGFRICMPSI